jgi:hypothetical protein
MFQTCAKILKRPNEFSKIKSNKRPIGFSHSDLSKVTKDYAISEKADGLNMLLAIEGRACRSMGLDGTELDVKLSKKFTCDGICLFECEQIGSKYLIFDVLIWNGENLTDQNFSQRYRLLKKHIPTDSKIVYLKQFYLPRKEGAIFKYAKKILKQAFDYEIDGLIFMPTKNKYYDPKARILKWKPPSHLTVDFLLTRTDIKNKYNVLVGMNKSQFFQLKLNHNPSFKRFRIPKKKYFPIPFKSEDLPKGCDVLIDREGDFGNLHDTIVEALWDGDAWIPKLIRKDKTAIYKKTPHILIGPNNWKVAYSTLKEALNPVTKDMIIGSKN